MITGRQIAAARELLKMSRAQLAEAADVGVSSVYRIEEGLSGPHKATLNAIVSTLEKRGIVFINEKRIGVAIEHIESGPPDGHPA